MREISPLVLLTSLDVNVLQYVRFFNRAVRVKHFQTIHDCGVNIARGLALLFGIGTKAVPS